MHAPTPGLPTFNYLKPTSLTEASRFLAEHEGEARLFMGGTDTFVRMRDGVWKEKFIVDVKDLEGMKGISYGHNFGLAIGAAVNMNRVVRSPEVNEHYPVLAEAAHAVASYQLRTRATVVGNICNASPAGDTIGAALVLHGALRIHGVGGTRLQPLSSFFLGPGKTVLKAGDIATALVIPQPPNGYAAKYIKLGRNALGDLAIVGVTVLGFPDERAPSGFRFRLALASVAPVPFVPTQAELILFKNHITEAVIDKAAHAAMEACNPIDDVRASARYRRHMVRNLTRKGVTAVWHSIKQQ